MRDGQVVRLTQELGDPDVAERLLTVRAHVVTDVPDEIARRHLRAISVASGTAAASAVTVGTATSAAASAGAGTGAACTAAAAGGLAASGASALGAADGLKLGLAALATAVATAGGLGATGHLPEPAQRIVDVVAGREAAPDDGVGIAHRTPADAEVRRTTRTPRASRADHGDAVARDGTTEPSSEGTATGSRQDVGVHVPPLVPEGPEHVEPAKQEPPKVEAAPPDGPPSTPPADLRGAEPRGGHDGSPADGTPAGDPDGTGRSEEAPERPSEPGPPAADDSDRSEDAPARPERSPSSPRAQPEARPEGGPPDETSADTADAHRGRQSG